MGLLTVLKEFIAKIEEAQIEYFLVGSMATMYYGRPRFTQDLDLVVRIKAKHVPVIEKLFPIEDFYCPPNEVIKDEIIRKGSFNFIHQKTGIKLNIILDKESDFYKSEFMRAKKIEIAPGTIVNIASPKDLVINKLIFYKEGNSEKHLNDIREIQMGTSLDSKYLEKWIAYFGLNCEWEKV